MMEGRAIRTPSPLMVAPGSERVRPPGPFVSHWHISVQNIQRQLTESIKSEASLAKMKIKFNTVTLYTDLVKCATNAQIKQSVRLFR
jgi:hypothetical protein